MILKVSLLLIVLFTSASLGLADPADEKAKPAKDIDAKLLALAKDLKSSKPVDRVKACDALGALGPSALPACRALCQSATDPNARVRKSALFALEKIDKNLFDAAVRIVIEHGVSGTLGQDEREGAEEVFENALKWKRASKDAKPIVPLIYFWWQYHQADRRTALVRDGSIETFDGSANAAIRALKEIVPNEKATARAFTAWLVNDPNPTVRALLAESIPGLAHQKDCVKTLVQSGWQDPDEKVRSAALAALRKVAGKEAVKVLATSAKKDRSDDVRGSAVELLGDLGPDAKDAATIVHDLCLDPNPTIRTLAAAALKQISKEKP